MLQELLMFIKSLKTLLAWRLSLKSIYSVCNWRLGFRVLQIFDNNLSLAASISAFQSLYSRAIFYNINRTYLDATSHQKPLKQKNPFIQLNATKVDLWLSMGFKQKAFMVELDNSRQRRYTDVKSEQNCVVINCTSCNIIPTLSMSDKNKLSVIFLNTK